MLNDKTKSTIHLIYGIFLSVVTIIAALCIILSCINLYQTDSYSREAVGENFSKISIAVYICLATVIGGFILDFAIPFQGKTKIAKQLPMQLSRLSEKVDLTKCDATISNAIYSERRKRNIHAMISYILLIVACLLFLPYILNGNNYHQSNINSSMINAVLLMAICLLIPFLYAIFASFYANKSMEKEISLLKQVKTFRETSVESTGFKKNPGILITQLLFVAIGIAFLLYGILTGGIADVLTKAINICTECIGLG